MKDNRLSNDDHFISEKSLGNDFALCSYVDGMVMPSWFDILELPLTAVTLLSTLSNILMISKLSKLVTSNLVSSWPIIRIVVVD